LNITRRQTDNPSASSGTLFVAARAKAYKSKVDRVISGFSRIVHNYRAYNIFDLRRLSRDESSYLV